MREEIRYVVRSVLTDGERVETYYYSTVWMATDALTERWRREVCGGGDDGEVMWYT